MKLRKSAAASSKNTLATREDISKTDVVRCAIPISKQISRTRMTLTKQKKINAPAESPAEFQQYIDAQVRSSSAEKWSMWTLPDYSVTDPVTVVPFSCDHMINSIAEFIKDAVSQSNTGDTKVLSLCSDATHDETAQIRNLGSGLQGATGTKMYGLPQ